VATFVSEVGADHRFWGGVLLRSGAVLAGTWLVLPSARAMTWRLWSGIAIFVAVVAARPRLVFYGFGIGRVIVVFDLGARARKRDRKDELR
jgi:hypothetical protein